MCSHLLLAILHSLAVTILLPFLVSSTSAILHSHPICLTSPAPQSETTSRDIPTFTASPSHCHSKQGLTDPKRRPVQTSPCAPASKSALPGRHLAASERPLKHEKGNLASATYQHHTWKHTDAQPNPQPRTRVGISSIRHLPHGRISQRDRLLVSTVLEREGLFNYPPHGAGNSMQTGNAAVPKPGAGLLTGLMHPSVLQLLLAG